MSDPLSISAGIVGLLQAVKSLYGFIDSIKDAPETLTRAGDDLKLSDSVLEDLHRYLEASPQDLPVVHELMGQRSALSLVLPQFKKLCSDFHKKLGICVRHSAEGSKLRWTDRVMTSLKKGSIERFQAEVSRNRQILSLRLEMITLLRTEQNTAAIQDFRQRNETAITSISRQLSDLHIAMTQVQELSDKSSEVLQKALRDQEAALEEQLLLCDENRATADRQARYEHEYGDTTVGDNSRNLQVLDLAKVRGSFKQKYGDTTIGNGTWNAHGAVGVSMVEKFFYGTAATSQAGRFQGPGRRLGGNISNLNGVRNGSTPETRQ